MTVEAAITRLISDNLQYVFQTEPRREMADDHKKFEIIVNGKPKPWSEDTISYSQVVELAFPGSHKPTEIFTVQYSRGPEENPQGTLVEGQSVKVKTGMVFHVTRTDKS